MPQPGTLACLLSVEQGKGLASLSRRSQGALSQGVSIQEEETEVASFCTHWSVILKHLHALSTFTLGPEALPSL